jgi:phosphoglycerate-specific signal transduction histidine kinase
VTPSVTAASSTTSLAAGAATTAGTPTTAAATTADTATKDEYKTMMSAWVSGPLQKLDTSVFDIPDPANATTQQIDAVAAFVTQAQAVLDQLKAIKPSAEALSAHNQYVKAYADLLVATDKYVSAMRTKDVSGLPGIQQAMSTAQTQIQQSMAILGPMIGMMSPTT